MSILRKILSVFPVTVLLTIGWPPVTQVAAGGLTHGVFHTPVGIDGPGLLRLGTTYETKNTLHPAESHLSPAFMYAESNDLFVGTPPGGIPLREAHGNSRAEDITGYLSLWDAGTEANQGPGTGSDQLLRQSQPNTGPVDPESHVRMAEDGYAYPPVPELVLVTVTPLAEDMTE